jgi:F-type H+-transporting ATPase subunit b
VLIDWFTVAAQIVNFLVLVALLKYFLYGRVIRVIDQREQDIAARIDDAGRQQERAREQVEAGLEKNRQLDAERKHMLSEAKQEADTRRNQWTHEARQQVDQLQRRWEQTVDQQKQQFLQDLRQRTGAQVLDVARRALADLTGVELQERLVETFIQRMQQLDEDEHRRVVGAVNGSAEPITVYSSWEIPDHQRGPLVETLRRHFGVDREVRFERDRDMVCGVELRSGGHAVGWSVDAYLDTLLETVSQEISTPTESKHD